MAFLLAGFALENLIKAFLVFEHPEWISNGTLARPLRRHSLTELASMSKLAPYRVRGARVLRSFEAGLESWARYPCALTQAETADLSEMTEELWRGYLRVATAYATRLMGLLQKGWRGPDGFFGRWDFSGEFLGVRAAKRPVRTRIRR